MQKLLKSINTFLYNDFVFSPRYKLAGHLIYWVLYTILWAGFWVAIEAPGSFLQQLGNMLLWLPIFIFYG